MILYGFGRRQALAILKSQWGGVFDGSYIQSSTRRGRYQHGLCPTLTAGQPEIYYYEGIEERDNV